MLGFFKARTRTAASAASPAAKPSMKVTPKGKTSRYRTFHKDEKGNEHGNRILVQDEDDNWYSEERNSKTGEVGYREYKVAGAGTDTRYNSITGRKEPVAEYDSKKQRIASDLAKYNQTLRQEGDYSKSSVEGLPHGLRMNVYAGVKNTKEFGDSVYLPPVEHRNKKTVERETREASYRESASKIGEYMGEKPKPKAPSGAKSSFEDIDALAEAHKVKPKAKPFAGADTSGAWAKYAESFKPAGTESAGSQRQGYSYDEDAYFQYHDSKKTNWPTYTDKKPKGASKAKPSSSSASPAPTVTLPPVNPVSSTPPQNQTGTQPPETDEQRKKRLAAEKRKATRAANKAAQQQQQQQQQQGKAKS